jgi:hypothetical protein
MRGGFSAAIKIYPKLGPGKNSTHHFLPRSRRELPGRRACDRAENENSQFTFEKFQVANYRSHLSRALFDCILFQFNALHSFSMPAPGWHVFCDNIFCLRIIAANN